MESILPSPQNEYYCGWESYGSPRIQDCRPLLESFANYQDTLTRFFDEEQLRSDRSGSWPGATSMLGPMQLDQGVQAKAYSEPSVASDTCNFALMSYIQEPDAPISTLGASDWATINAAGNMMLTQCLLTGPISQGGVVVIRNSLPPHHGALSLWMWASGSIFDMTINSVTNHPGGIIPTPSALLNISRDSINLSTSLPNLPMTDGANAVVNSEVAS